MTQAATAASSGSTAKAPTSYTVVALGGDGIGPEVMREAIRALGALPVEIAIDQRPFGGTGIRECGDPLPAATLRACLAADAVLARRGRLA